MDLIQGQLSDLFFNTENRRPRQGDILADAVKVWIYERAVTGFRWEPLCKIENEPAGPYDLDFQIPNTDILIAQPLETCLAVLFRYNAQMPAPRAEDFIKAVLKLMTEAQWRAPDECPEDGQPGVVSCEFIREMRSREQNFNVPNIGPVLKQLRSQEPLPRIHFTDDTGSFISIDTTACSLIYVDVEEKDEPTLNPTSPEVT